MVEVEEIDASGLKAKTGLVRVVSDGGDEKHFNWGDLPDVKQAAKLVAGLNLRPEANTRILDDQGNVLDTPELTTCPMCSHRF